MKSFLDLILGPSVRVIMDPPFQKTLYLTFDDGPNPESTPQVLATLTDLEVPATFFVIGEKVVAHRELIRQIQAYGHAVGNHSWNHRYESFFSGRTRMREWIKHSEEVLTQELGTTPVGFRSPAGVRTPELHWALQQLNIPLVLWNQRFFDTTFVWSKHRALRSLKKTSPGSIVLLHDSQPPTRLSPFLNTLSAYIKAARQEGFEFKVLTRTLCQTMSGK